MLFHASGRTDEVYGHGPAGDGPIMPPSFGQVVMLPVTRRASPTAVPDSDLCVTAIHHLGNGALCAADITPIDLGLQADGQRLIRGACRQAASWRLAVVPSGLAVRAVLPMPRQSGRSGAMATHLALALAEADVPAGHLELAFAEADPAMDGREMPLLVSALRDLGAHVAIDRVRRAKDCLRLLRRLPVTALRLHPVLIRDMEDNADARAEVMEAICTAHAMGAIAVALGVQSALQRDILTDMQCDEAQGPLFSAAMPAEAFRRAVAEPE